MESINNLGELLIVISEEVTYLNDAFIELDNLINKEAEYLQRQERACKINELESRLVSEINRIKHEERSSEYSFNTSKVYSGILGLAVGGIVGVVLKQESPFSLGYKLYSKELEKKAGFSTVMMALKEGDKLEDIEAIAISRLARESKTTEADIMSSLERQGYSLMTTGQLLESLDQLKVDIKEEKS